MSLRAFYVLRKDLLEIIDLLNGKSIISLRLIDWFVTNYAKRYNIGYALNGQEFMVYLNYKNQIKAYSKKIFDHLRMGKKEIQNGKYGIESFTKAQELINHGLLATLDYKNGGEIAQNLKVLYEWSLTELILARVGRSEEKVQSVIDVLTNLYEGWCSMNPSASN
jgi:flagellar biosynthetic protein FliS